MLKKSTIVVLILIFSASIASASIVDANSRQGHLDIGFGSAGLWYGGNLQYGISDNLSLGADYAVVDLTLAGGWIFILIDEGTKLTGEIYDVHLNYQFIEGNQDQPVAVSVLAGIGGTQSKTNGTINESRTVAVGGLCLSSPIFAGNIIGRLNLVFGPPLGAEFAWKISEHFEFNAGVSATGFFGLKVSF